MRKVSFLLMLMVLVFSTQQTIAAEPLVTDWQHSFEEAKAKAAKEGKSILMSFAGSDWCLPCIRLDKEFFNTEQFQSYAEEKFVLLRLDFPARKKNQLSPEQVKHNEALAEKYNKKGSFPLVLVLDESGKVQGQMTTAKGNSSDYFKELNSIISQ